MMKRSIVGINAVIVVCFTIILVYQENWILLFLLALLLAGFYFLWADRQKEYLRELGEISVCLDNLLQKKRFLIILSRMILLHPRSFRRFRECRKCMGNHCACRE